MVSRRSFLAGGSAAATLAMAPRAFAQWQPSQRYPDPSIKIIDPSFARYRIAQTKVEKIAAGMRWCEGPVYFGDARCVIWSDIPNNRLMRYDEVRARSASIANPPTTPTAIAVTARGALSPASTRRGGSRAPNTMARSRC